MWNYYRRVNISGWYKSHATPDFKLLYKGLFDSVYSIWVSSGISDRLRCWEIFILFCALLTYFVWWKVHQCFEKRRSFEKRKTRHYGSCSRYLHVLLTELENRIPENSKIFEDIEKYKPRNCLNQMCQLPASLPIELRDKFRELSLTPWMMDTADRGLFVLFWVNALEYKCANGDSSYKSLALQVLKILSIRMSNAIVERFLVFKIK